ncbi:MAG: type III pantothenate kinase [Acidimicrobiia bacterium]|nr:type III pantothenate kinase [Acidimicrobiia bacterium]
MRLVFDIGNTTISYSLYDDGLVNPKRIRSNEIKTTQDITELVISALKESNNELDEIVVCAGVSRIRALVYDYASVSTIPVHFVYGSNLCGAKISYETPETIGPDRVANSIAAQVIYKKNVIVVDCGTAITIDAIDENGIFVGGVIAPGIETQRNSLTQSAPALPEVELSVPDDILGSNTIDCIKSGVIFGSSSMIDSVVGKISAKNGYNTFVLTGGNSHILKSILETDFIHDDFFTLKGLGLAKVI